MSLTILTLEALDDLADGISPGPWSLNDRLECVDADGDPLLTDNGAVTYQSDENLFLAAPAVLATARALYAERDDDDGWKREATAVLADIADAVGPAALLGESHGATIRRLIVERNDFALLARSGHAGATWLTQEKGKAEDRLDLAREILEEAIKALPPHDPNADHVRAMARTWLEASDV